MRRLPMLRTLLVDLLVGVRIGFDAHGDFGRFRPSTTSGRAERGDGRRGGGAVWNHD